MTTLMSLKTDMSQIKTSRHLQVCLYGIVTPATYTLVNLCSDKNSYG